MFHQASNYVYVHNCSILRIIFIACGNLDRLSHGVLWPITKVNRTAEVFCSDVNPSFGFGPYATRRCRGDETWSTVDTSQCSIRPMQTTTFVVFSAYFEVDRINNNNITKRVSIICM